MILLSKIGLGERAIEVLSISDYKKLLDLPNLVLLHPTVDPNEILKK